MARSGGAGRSCVLGVWWAWHRARSGEDRPAPFCRALPTLAGGRLTSKAHLTQPFVPCRAAFSHAAEWGLPQRA